MATNVFERYGIKEVADVTFFEIQADGTEKPVLHLDSLKISTIEETAEQVEAKGGKGNSPLVIWDYGKEITVSIQDALYSPRSMALMHDADGSVTTTTSAVITKYMNVDGARYTTKSAIEELIKGKLRYAGSSAPSITVKNYYKGDATVKAGDDTSLSGTTTSIPAENLIVEYEVTAENKTTIDINAEAFPGTYKMVGDTYARSAKTGKDEYFQFIIYKAKMSAETTITLEAEGDPSVFDMNMRVMRPDDGKMMSLVQYSL